MSVSVQPGAPSLPSMPPDESLAAIAPGWQVVSLLGLWLGILGCAYLSFASRFGLTVLGGSPQMDQMAGVALLMAVWWLTEAVPAATTALVPLAAFPLLGLQTAAQVSGQYAAPTVFLFLGGFFLALAVEQSGLHRRIALNVLSMVGVKPVMLSLGFILTTTLLSMWASNTATTLLMMPIALSVMGQLRATSGRSEAADQPEATESLNPSSTALEKILPLGIAYGASLGGMATPVGTPVNAQFLQYLRHRSEADPSLGSISFAQWMMLGIPLSLTLSVLAWIWLNWWFRSANVASSVDANYFSNLRRRLGPMHPAEMRVAGIFALTMLLWVLREPYQGAGWSQWLPNSKAVDDGTVAMLMAIFCFLLPSGGCQGTLLAPQAFLKVRWDVLLLFGGGLALAKGMESTGLDLWLGEHVASLAKGLPYWALIAVAVAGVTLIGEFATNVAAVNMMLPVFDGVARSLGIPPLVILWAVAMASSCGFALPVATPPNAIAYATGSVRMRDMVWAGLGVDLICILGITLFSVFWSPFR